MSKLSNAIVSICLALFMIGLSVIITLNIKTIYYNDIDKLNIEALSGLSRDEIIQNYDYLIDYNLSSKVGDFKLPTLPSSKEGTIHFEEVRDIFQNVKNIILASGVVAVIGSVILIKKRKLSFLRNASLLIIILPILLAIPIAVNFNACFVLFHEIMFSNDYWIFNPQFDPVINMLPEAFFMHMGVAILVFMLISSVALQIIYRVAKKYNN